MIFTGDWFDGEGVPFDRNARTIKNTGTCGIAAGKRSVLINHPSHQNFKVLVWWCRDHWVDMMDPAPRAAWEADAANGPARRGDVDRVPTNGWIHWNAATFAQAFYTPPPPITYPVGPADQTWTDSQIYYIKPPNQTISFWTTYTNQLPECTSNRFCVYQINPKKVRAANPWRQTRLIDIATMTDAVHPTYHVNRALRWPVKVGDHVALYFRGRARSFYNYHAIDIKLSEYLEWP